MTLHKPAKREWYFCTVLLIRCNSITLQLEHDIAVTAGLSIYALSVQCTWMLKKLTALDPLELSGTKRGRRDTTRLASMIGLNRALELEGLCYSWQFWQASGIGPGLYRRYTSGRYLTWFESGSSCGWHQVTDASLTNLIDAIDLTATIHSLIRLLTHSHSTPSTNLTHNLSTQIHWERLCSAASMAASKLIS